MSPDFCWDIWIIPSEFGMNNQALIYPVLHQHFRLVLVIECFLGPPGTNWASSKGHSLPEYCYCPCLSFYDLLMATSSRIMHLFKSSNHLKLFPWTLEWVPRTQSERAPLGWGGWMEDSKGNLKGLHDNIKAKTTEECLWFLFGYIQWGISNSEGQTGHSKVYLGITYNKRN